MIKPGLSKVIIMPRALLILFFCVIFVSSSYAAPCYGTRLPEKQGFCVGVQSYSVFKRYLEGEFGSLRSTQHFLLVSYGVFDWLSIDLKGGTGNIKQHPLGSDEVDYASNFAGGYGFRLRLYNSGNVKTVFGFQHISVHPKSTHLGDIKNSAVLDDWQVSLLLSRQLRKLTPYLGTRWSRADYIHWIGGERKRVMSDLTKSSGLIIGLDIAIKEKFWLNFEGQLLDSEAFALSLNFGF